MLEKEFRKHLGEQGFDAPNRKEWPPGFQDKLHTHDRDVFLLVLEGELILCLEDSQVTYQAGDSCNLAAHTLHTEKTGDQGAVTLVALR